MKKSIIQEDMSYCYLCGRQYGLEEHHVMSGYANRRLSEKYHLTVALCASCHRGTEGAQYDGELNIRLRREAQEAFEKFYSHEMWMNLFKKNYL